MHQYPPMPYVTGARCTLCGKVHNATPVITTCNCGGILDIEYDYPAIALSLTPRNLALRAPTMWRYRELLPLAPATPIPPLAVGWSPLYRGGRLGEEIGLTNLFIKDDGQNPTASLKDRASALAVAKAVEGGFGHIACASTGNAASSLAGSAAAAGLSAHIFVPLRAPKGKVTQLRIFGADITLVDGSYEETFRQSALAIEKNGWYNRNAAINPYLSEGKKTVALEICEQLGWRCPDFVALSVGDGCTIAGVWKGFCDLFALGLITRKPRLIAVQAAGCAPLCTAAASGKPWVSCGENTLADSIAVGVPRNAKKALDAIAQSQGIPITVTDDEILSAMGLLGRLAGVFGEPAGVAGTAGLINAVAQGLVPKDALTVTLVTGNGLKDVDNAIRAVQLKTGRCNP